MITRTWISIQRGWPPALCVLLAWTLGFAGYKARPWTPRPRESYAAREISQGMTIAVDPLFRNQLAAQVFDKDDIVSRGIMPLAIIVFNDNDFAVQINGATVELTQDNDRIRTLEPDQFVPLLFKKTGSRVKLPIPVPKSSSGGANYSPDALQDFDHKFLRTKTIGPHQTGGGFLYFRVPQSVSLPAQLSKASVYIPDVYREDSGSRMMFYEIDLKPAIEGAPSK